MIQLFLRNRKLIFMMTLLLVSMVMGASPPTECFANAAELINDRGPQLAVTTDKTAVSELTYNHEIVKVDICLTDSYIVGLRVTFGIFDVNGGGDYIFPK